MRLLGKVRFSLATIMMLVVTSAAAVALYAKVFRHVQHITTTGWKLDVPSLFLLAIALTAMALASWKEHSANQAMLQMTLACVGCLILIGICEAQYDRMVRYWFQGSFAATVSLPLLVRRYVKSELPRGPRRDFWKKSCEM